MERLSPERQVAVFMARFNPEIVRVARQARTKLRAQLPGAFELVYDNYNALVIAFGPTDRASDVLLSIALYPRWVNLFLAHGARLPDPTGILKGQGTRVRHIVLERASVLDKAPVRTLIKAALARLPRQFPPGQRRRTIIKSISKKQRPRRP